jgi:hypothetical protein
MKTNNLNTKIFLFIFISLLVSFPAGLFSQETSTCAEKLKTAQSSFDKGLVEVIPGLLQHCLTTGGFKKEEELAAYKLLIQTYLLDDKLQQADSAMYEFLKKNPEYQLSPTDHSSFVYLFNNFKVKPVVQISVHAGTNIPFLTAVNEHLTTGEGSSSKYKSNIGNLFISLETKFKVSDKVEGGVEAGFSMLKFSNKVNTGSEILSYEESQKRVEVPVSLTYDAASFGKFKLYTRLGVGAAFNLGVTSTASSSPVAKNNNNSRTGESLDRKDSRIALDLFGQLGAGIKYKVSKGFLFAEARSNFGILNQNVSGGKTIPMAEFYYKWRDPDFRLNAVNINVGYTYIFYKPTKR